MINILTYLDEAAWAAVPAEVGRLVKLAAGPARIINTAAEDLPGGSSAVVWYEPDEQVMLVSGCGIEKAADWVDFLSQVPFVQHAAWHADEMPSGTWLLVKRAEEELQAKTILGPVAMLAGHKPGVWPFAPNTLTATIGSALIGAGAGYGTGWLGEHLLPEQHFRKGTLRRNLAIAGGLAGAVPSLWYGLNGGYKPEVGAAEVPAEVKAGSDLRDAGWALYDNLSVDERRLSPAFARAVRNIFKQADDSDGMTDNAVLDTSMGGSTGAMFLPSIPTDRFNTVVWGDPFTPAPLRAATSGIVEAASLSRGGVNYITPLDIARIGLGAGAGYASAMLVGKTLGALAGLRPESQKTLQRVGTWAGIISNVVPLFFGGAK